MLGRTLNHYELLDVIGQGGMGVVYKARDQRLNRLVAVKVLPVVGQADPARSARFLREAIAASALNHPGIVAIYDIGTSDGMDYIAMELVTGHPLTNLIPPSGLPAAEAVRLLRDVVEALHCAHAAGIVHRDLKPPNIMVAASGAVKVLDFGLAKREESAKAGGTLSTLTSPGMILGTAAYMAPEQAQGHHVDARADIFSCGVILYELLSGRNPFLRDSNVATLASILRDDPPPIPGVSRALSAILERCLRKDRNHRYPDAGHLLTALDNAGMAADRSLPFVAVLPFVNVSADPENEYFCDGLSEEILNLLAGARDLRVIARTSAFAWKGKSEDIRTIGAKLGVDCVLEGSVRRHNDRLRITAQLVNTLDGQPLWSSRFDRTLTDLFVVQDEIANEVVKALRGTLLTVPAIRIPAAGAAHDAYLRGRYHWNRFTLDSMVKAADLFEKARAIDPSYALAHVGVADCYLQLGHSRAGYLRPLDAFPKAREAVDAALQIDASLADAHCALACCRYWHDWDWAGAEQAFAHAVRLNPNHATCRQWYALYLATSRRFDEARGQIGQALSLDPLSPLVNTYAAAIEYYAGDYGSALSHAERLTEMAPDYVWGRYWLALVHGDGGDPFRAVDVLYRLLPDAPGMAIAVGKLAYYAGLAGQPDLARSMLTRLDEMSRGQFVDPMLYGWCWIGLGEEDKAVEAYDAAYRERSPLFTIVPVDASSLVLSDRPAFKDLLNRLRYPATALVQ